jgi:hypothetical protein
MELTIELANPNGDQRIEAPARSRPLSDLQRSLGGAGGLGALGGVPDAGGDGGSQPPSGGGGQGSGGSQTAPDAEAFRRYADCLDKADPGDTQALQDCARLLR